jgi:hypothetical protein
MSSLDLLDLCCRDINAMPSVVDVDKLHDWVNEAWQRAREAPNPELIAAATAHHDRLSLNLHNMIAAAQGVPSLRAARQHSRLWSRFLAATAEGGCPQSRLHMCSFYAAASCSQNVISLDANVAGAQVRQLLIGGWTSCKRSLRSWR